MRIGVGIRIALLAAFWFLLSNCGGGAAVETINIELEFESFQLRDVATALELRLVESGGQPTILSSHRLGDEALLVRATTLAAGEDASAFNVATISAATGAADWDAASVPDSGYAVVHTEPGSGRCPVLLRTPGAEKPAAVDQQHPFAVLRTPRFAKRASDVTATISAAKRRDSTQELVLYRRMEDGAFEDPISIFRCEDGDVEEGFLIQAPDRELAACRCYVPDVRDAEDQSPAETLEKASGLLSRPGVLSCAVLDADYKEVGDRFQPLAQRRIFEFDADFRDSLLVAFMRTRDGIALAWGYVGAATPIWHVVEKKQPDSGYFSP
ncbi:MAG: hypothetical protein ABIJ61_04180, partial [bacterium]